MNNNKYEAEKINLLGKDKTCQEKYMHSEDVTII